MAEREVVRGPPSEPFAVQFTRTLRRQSRDRKVLSLIAKMGNKRNGEGKMQKRDGRKSRKGEVEEIAYHLSCVSPLRSPPEHT